MPLSGKRDEAEKRFKEAKRYSHPEKKEFDLDGMKPPSNNIKKPLSENKLWRV